MQWPFYLRPEFVKLGTNTDYKTPKVSSNSRKKNGSSSLDSTIAFRNGGAASASPKAIATIVGQPHHANMRILVVDEHPLFRHGVMEFIKALKAQYPELRILVFSQFEETIFAERALRAGANGYLMKDATNEELLTAVRDIVCGGIYVSRKIALHAFQKSLETPRQNYPQENIIDIEILSDREMHVFQLLGSGLGTKKIAEALNLSVKTVESHRENIKRRLGLRSGADLTGRATAWVMENFLPPDKSEISVVKKKKVLPFRAA